jgi:5'-deoxynucleotidase YfbR-like HD superfamily hydrolase
MTTETIREKIRTDDDFVLAEIARLQYLYRLQRVIRSGLTRTETVQTESVADHLYGMGVLVSYFAKLEDLEDKLAMATVARLITWHDIGEIVTGDVIGFLKTASDRQYETSALAEVIAQSPILLQTEIATTIQEYKAQETLEARFVKAVDKIDPVIYFFNDNGKKVFTVSPATKAQHCAIKEPYIKDFPYISRFHTVTLPIFEQRGFFSDCK